ncbi:MAG TPA: glycine dehydrogenase, partial [Minicystis sp.]|nr:glycine dehydrogenase [Minicystis sp.]
MRYLPHTDAEIAEMLRAVGASSLDELFASIPKEARLGRPLDIPRGVDEPTLMRELEALGAKNTGARMLSFLGAGAYDHHFPPAADQLLLRSE